MSRAQSFERSRIRIAFLLRPFVGLCGFAFLVASASSVNSPADDISLPADYGYVLIRIIMETTPRASGAVRERIVFKNYDTGESFSVRVKAPYSAGVNASLSLISATKGHYYFSQFVSSSPLFSFAAPIAKTALSVDDIFEVKSGVVNYVGDWKPRLDMNRPSSLSDLRAEYCSLTTSSDHRLF